MENKISFTWIPFYEELAKKLLAYKNNRSPLIKFIYAEDGLKACTEYLQRENKDRINDIDPFSFFGIFNRHISKDNRISILSKLKVFFDLESSIPDDFDGIPILNYARSFFFHWGDDFADSCNALWEAFSSFMENDSVSEFMQYHHFKTRKSEATIPFFWFKPNDYIALDSNNCSYLRLNNIVIDDKIENIEQYIALIKTIKEKIQNKEIEEDSIPEFSYQAWKFNNTKHYWIAKVTDDNYWDCAIENNLWLTQQRYGQQTTQTVTSILERLMNVTVGDVLLLAYENGIYAYGNVIECPFETPQLSSLKTVIKNRKYEYDIGIVRYKETDVFYEDLEKGCSNWGQRIKVDKWHYYNHMSLVSTQGVKNHLKNNGIAIESLYEIKAEFGEMKIKELELQYQQNNMNTYQVSKILTTNHNLILTGAPGTGKTYLAKQIAQQLIFGEVKENLTDDEQKQFNEQCGFVQFHPSYDYTDFVEGLRPIQDDNGNVGFERKDGVFKEFCKRALPYSLLDEAYSALIQDIKSQRITDIPLRQKQSSGLVVTDNDRIRWYETNNTTKIATHSVSRENIKQLYNKYNTLKSLNNLSDIDVEIRKVIGTCNSSYYYGVLHYLIEKIEIRKTRKLVFIIDEINRGEISKIFGELFFSIDPDYRGEKGKVRTQYQNMVEAGDEFYDGFYVPENVYIIGTMNDIDRSVESMDFAFRRRFAFKEIKADESIKMLDELGKLKDGAIERMKRLNAEISSIEGLSSAYHIGAAYFLKLKNYASDVDGGFENLWNNHLEGLLREYLRGVLNVEESIAKLNAAYNK